MKISIVSYIIKIFGTIIYCRYCNKQYIFNKGSFFIKNKLMYIFV